MRSGLAADQGLVTEVDNKLEDIEQDEAAQAQAQAPATPKSSAANDDSTISEDPAMDASFMSESIYQKIPSPKSVKQKSISKSLPLLCRGGTLADKTGKRSMPILHEHFSPGSEIKQMTAHSDMVTAIDFDYPFGTMITAALDDTVRVWDLNVGRCIGFLEGHNASVRCLQIEDNIVATGSMDASVKLWDLSRARTMTTRDNRITRRDDGDEETVPADDASVASHSTTLEDCFVYSLDAHVDEITALHFKGDTLISGSADKTLRQWDLVKGRCVQTLDVLWAAAQASSLGGDSQWRPSGRLPDASADFVGAVQCFDAALACGTADGMVRLWDLRSGQVHRSLVGHTGPVTCLQFDDVHLVTGSQDRSIRVCYFVSGLGCLGANCLQIWDLRMGSIYDAYAYDKPITSMMFDTKRIVAAAGENVVKVYDKADGHHWDCGAGVGADEQGPSPATVERVRLKDGFLVEGRKDGIVAAWTC